MTLVKAFGLPTLTKTLQTLSLTYNRSLSTTSILGISVSPIILGQPSKKKSKVDPIAQRRKEEKRKNRLIKALRKMEKKERLPRPLSGDTYHPALNMIKEQEIRSRNVSTCFILKSSQLCARHYFKEYLFTYTHNL